MSTRVKVSESSNVHALIRTKDGKGRGGSGGLRETGAVTCPGRLRVADGHLDSARRMSHT